MHLHKLCVLLALSAFILPSTLDAQRKKKDDEKWKEDPYTKNDEAAMKKAGYVSFGPFGWGDNHGTTEILAMFPEVKLRFVETAHFKIGSSLPTYSLPKGNKASVKLEKKILAAELKRLKKKLPSVKSRYRKLDPWLRLHLYAQRLEETYADFSERIGVTDADFPTEAKQRIANASGSKPGEAYMGQGPYLGMRGKFLILLMKKGGNLNRYAAKARGTTFQAKGKPDPQRYYFTKTGSLFFGTACECGKGSLFSDHALHCHVVFNTVQSLVDGYKDFFFALPVWSREGLSHWYLRNIDPKEHCFTGMKGRSNEQRYGHDWDVKTKKRLRHDDYTPGKEVLEYMKFEELTFGDHMAIWSRMDYLQSLGSEKFAKFLGLMKDAIKVEAGKNPTEDQVRAQQRSALKAAYGFDYDGFDTAWKAFVKKTYPNK